MCASYVVNIHFHNLLKLKTVTTGRQAGRQTYGRTDSVVVVGADAHEDADADAGDDHAR